MLIYVIAALILLSLFLGDKTNKYYLWEKQRKYVLFCTASEELHSNSDLLDTINNNNALYITDEEREIFFTILRGYQFEMFRLFSSNNLTKDKKMLSLSRENFYVSTFKAFLNEHSTNHSFLNNDLMVYKKKIDSDTAEYKLTDFGYVYYKTLFATFNYEEQKGTIPKGSSDYLKEAIASRSIQIMRYVP